MGLGLSLFFVFIARKLVSRKIRPYYIVIRVFLTPMILE